MNLASFAKKISFEIFQFVGIKKLNLNIYWKNLDYNDHDYSKILAITFKSLRIIYYINLHGYNNNQCHVIMDTF